MAVCFVVLGGLLGACVLDSLGDRSGDRGDSPPDAMDRVRSTDLLPRFLKPLRNSDTGSRAGLEPVVAYGSPEEPQAAAQRSGARDGEG